jgi:16S rRNA processing protein RimM
MTEYFKIGKIVASYGFKGDLILKHSLGKKTSLKGLEKFFIEEARNSFIPFFPTSSSIKSDSEVLLKIDGIDTKEKTAQLIQKEVWLTETDFKKYSSKTAPISYLGYLIMDGKQEVGTILEIIEQPHQLLCKVDHKGKEALIPVHEHNLLEIDTKKRILFLELPEGLLEIYSE